MDDETPTKSRSGFPIRKLSVFAIVAIAGFALWITFRDSLTLNSLASSELQLREFQREHPAMSFGAAFLAYVVVTALSIPGATAMTLAYGWFFGVVRGMVLVSLASTTGATLAFLLSRYLFREAVQRRFEKRLETFNRAWERDGVWYLLLLRLVPGVPFFVINAVMGLTSIRVWTYWWVSQLGMLPATFVYVYAGSSVPSLSELAEKGVQAVLTPWQLTQIFLALAALGLFPILVRWGVRGLIPRRHGDTEDGSKI